MMIFICLGLVLLIFGFIVFVAKTMTEPLAWMGRVAKSIVKRGGDSDITADLGSQLNEHTPDMNNEIGVLTDSFKKLVSGLAHSGAAKHSTQQFEASENRYASGKRKQFWAAP